MTAAKRTKRGSCPDCGVRLRGSNSTNVGEGRGRHRDARLHEHRGSIHCLARRARNKLLGRGFTVLQHKLAANGYLLGYHELKDADMVEMHQTQSDIRDGYRHHQAWGPKWAFDYANYLRDVLKLPFRKRVETIKEIAAEPDGPACARAMLALAKRGDDGG